MCKTIPEISVENFDIFIFNPILKKSKRRKRDHYYNQNIPKSPNPKDYEFKDGMIIHRKQESEVNL